MGKYEKSGILLCFVILCLDAKFTGLGFWYNKIVNLSASLIGRTYYSMVALGQVVRIRIHSLPKTHFFYPQTLVYFYVNLAYSVTQSINRYFIPNLHSKSAKQSQSPRGASWCYPSVSTEYLTQPGAWLVSHS